MEGDIKKYTRKGSSGKDVTYQFCPICPTIVAVELDSMPDKYIVKPGGCKDDTLLRETEPSMEIFVKNRYPWVKPTGAEEHQEGP